MQEFSYFFSLLLVAMSWVIWNFLYVGRDIITALLFVEGWWISMYFLISFTALYTGVHFAVILLPLVLVFAGLEVVLGFYFLYFI